MPTRFRRVRIAHRAPGRNAPSALLISVSLTVQPSGPNCPLSQGTIGAQLCGTSQANSPRYTIRPRLEGSATAAAAERDRPGPGKYNHPPAFGNQVASTRNSSANYSFGTSERHNPATNPNRVPYIGKDFDKVYFGAPACVSVHCSSSARGSHCHRRDRDPQHPTPISQVSTLRGLPSTHLVAPSGPHCRIKRRRPSTHLVASRGSRTRTHSLWHRSRSP